MQRIFASGVAVVAVLAAVGCAGASSSAEEPPVDRFAKFPAINQFRPGERTSAVITSDGAANLVRPKWTRAMGDMGGWPIMFRFKDKIYLQYPHLDAHRGAKLEGKGEIISLVSADDGRSWAPTEKPLPGADEVLVAKDTLFCYRSRPGGASTQVSTSADAINFSAWKDAYKAPFCMWGVTYDPVSQMFWAPPHAIPVNAGQGTRQIHLVRSKDGIEWEYVATIHANSDESESIVRFEKDRTAVVLIRKKWGSRVTWLALAKPPYKEWAIKEVNQETGGHHFVEIGGQVFVPSRASYTGKDPAVLAAARPYGNKPYYSAVFKFTDDHQLVPWAVMDSMGDCSYPQLVETKDEVLCAWYSQHEDKICKVFLCAYDKKEFLAGPKPVATAPPK